MVKRSAKGADSLRSRLKRERDGGARTREKKMGKPPVPLRGRRLKRRRSRLLNWKNNAIDKSVQQLTRENKLFHYTRVICRISSTE